MNYFFTENTLVNVFMLMILLVLLVLNGWLVHRISKVRIKAIQSMSDRLLSLASTILVVGVLVWLIINYDGNGLATTIIIGILGIMTRVLSQMAAGLTEKDVQYEAMSGAGYASLFTQLTKTVYRLPYAKIQEVRLEESEVLELKIKQKLRTVRLRFPLEKKQKVERFLKKKSVL